MSSKKNPFINACVFDLECSSLNADFGVVLCGVIKPAVGEPQIYRLDKLSKCWDTKRSYDYPVIKAIVDALSEFDIVAAHNGLRFDLPFLRTRMARWRMDPLRESKLIDPVQIARNKLKMSSNSLDRITAFLGCNSKSEVDGEQWLKASLDGSRAAMNYIVRHCVEDVKMLEEVVRMVKGYSKTFNGWGSAF
jgi:uncharacterized protein YprB with RNaseH-like and TPR domain